nr:hypothetical protein [Pseudomonas sp. EggHat1]
MVFLPVLFVGGQPALGFCLRRYRRAPITLSHFRAVVGQVGLGL